MIRWILSLLIILLTWTSVTGTGLAQTQDNPPLTEEQLEEGQSIAKKAIAATENGNFAQAETYWTQLVETFPSNPAAWSNRGNARVSQNKLEAAIADFNQAIELAPEAADPYLNRGTALEAQGKYDEAIADYNRVLELNPDDAMAYNNRGNAKSGEGEWEQALTDYRKASEIAPNFALPELMRP